MPSRSRGFFSSEDGLCLGFFICVSRKVDGGFFLWLFADLLDSGGFLVRLGVVNGCLGVLSEYVNG